MPDPTLDHIANMLGNALGDLAARVLEGLGARRRSRALDAGQGRTLARAVVRAARADRPDLTDEQWLPAARVLLECLRAGPINVDGVLDAGPRPDTLERRIRRDSVDIWRDADLDGGRRTAFDTLLTEVSRRVVEFVRSRPDFPASGRPGPSRRQPGDPAHAAFEQRYRDFVAATLGRFELFGAYRGRVPRTQPFEQSYVSLAVARTGGADQENPHDPDELTGAGIDVTNGFADNRRALVRGSAGSGKTTLLQWLAAGHAANPDGPWGAVVPFLVHLRDFTERELPSVEELPRMVARAIDTERPAGWATARFLDGAALLLVDGVDEVPATGRAAVHTWLADLVTAYPGARYVVTSRPFALREDWLDAAGFVTFDLLPLSAKGIRDLIKRWHDVVREERREDRTAQRYLDECEIGLNALMAGRPELRRLAGSPLLCGLLCALHQDRNMNLPLDRRSLYEAALELLLVRWDEQRGLHVDDGAGLSLEEQIVLLQRFAYSLVKNHDLVLPRDEVVRRFGHAMRGLRPHHDDPAVVLQHSLERTGLLQEPRPDQIQFVHRTFRDFLAAKEVVDSGDLSFLIEQAHLDQWQDVVIMAVAHARPSERERVLRGLLDGNAEAHQHRRVHDRLRLLAAACLEQAHVMNTDEVRREVQRAAARLIPPASLDEAELLARAGSFVLDLLPGPDGLTPDQAARVVRTIAGIGGEGARTRIAPFSRLNESLVVDELLRAWRNSDDPERYAQEVLADIDFGDREVTIRGWHRVRYLHHLAGLHNLLCPGDLTPLTPIGAMPELRRLELNQNSVLRDLWPLANCRKLAELRLAGCAWVRDLAPLTACRSLGALFLSGCPQIRDLAPLAASTVDDLGLYLLVNSDLGSLSGAGLTRLAVRDRRLADGLHPLPADLPLRRLRLDNLAIDRNLRGVERWTGLEWLLIHGAPDPEETDLLRRLPNLRHLVIRDPAPPDALAALQTALPTTTITLEIEPVP